MYTDRRKKNASNANNKQKFSGVVEKKTRARGANEKYFTRVKRNFKPKKKNKKTRDENNARLS